MLRARVGWTLMAVVGLFVECSSGWGGEPLLWQNDLAQAQSLSWTHDRPLLIYVTTAGCPYCRRMEQQTWPDDVVHQRLQTRFVPLRLDAENHPELIAQLGVKGFPTTLIYGTDRRRLAEFVGYAPPDRVLRTLDQLLASGKPRSARDEHCNRSPRMSVGRLGQTAAMASCQPRLRATGATR